MKIGRFPGWTFHTTRFAVVLTLFSFPMACVSVRVEPLTQQQYPPKPTSEAIEILDAEPVRPHVNLARIITTSENASEERLREKILSVARRVGADAVVLGQADVLHSLGPSPAYQSTLGPASASFSPYTWGGWWNPFYLDAWSFVQGASDQTAWTMYLSGLAVRYGEDAAAGGSR